MGVEAWVEPWLGGGELVWRPWVRPMAWVWLVGVLVVVAAGWSWWRTVGEAGWHRAIGATGLLGMRVLTAGTVVLLLAGPSVVARSATEPTRGVLCVMLDTSASMARDDVAPSRAGWAIERWLSPAVLERIGATHDVRVRVFDSAARAVRVESLRELGGQAATGAETRLTQALREVVGEAAPSATTGEGGAIDGAGPWSVLLLTDGRESTDVSPLTVAEAARRAGVSVHAAAFGTAVDAPDLAVTAEVEPTYLLVGEPGRVRVRVLRGGPSVEEAVVRLTRGDDEQTRRVRFDGRRLATVDLPVIEEAAGTFAYTVSVDAVDGEAELRNNHQPVFVDVLADRFDVLLLEGQPTWDTRFIARALRRDERVSLTQMTRLSADRLERLTARVSDDAATGGDAVAPDELRWGDYDVVILGGGMDRLLTDRLIDTLPGYVAELGGRVVFAHGRPYDPTTRRGRRIAEAWRALEPVRWGGGIDRAIRVRPRSAAFEHPTFAFSLDPSLAERVIAALPTVRAVAVAEGLSPAAEVLATAAAGDASSVQDDRDLPPAMVTMPYDRGVVTAILAQGMWRWAMLEADRQTAAGAWDRFWSNTVRWLALGGAFRPGEDVSLRLSERAVHTEQTVWVDVVRRSLDDGQAIRLEVERPDGTTRPMSTVAVGGGELRRRASLEPDQPGVYRVVAILDGQIVAESMLSVYDADRERLDTTADPSMLEALAHATGGRLLDPDRPDELIALLERQRAARLVPPRPEYLWDRWWVMAALLSWLGLEWIGRRAAGMI